jgi:hypothetical protein
MMILRCIGCNRDFDSAAVETSDGNRLNVWCQGCFHKYVDMAREIKRDLENVLKKHDEMVKEMEHLKEHNLDYHNQHICFDCTRSQSSSSGGYYSPESYE